MPSEPVTVTQTLEPWGPATAIELTPEQVDQLGGGRRAAVRVTVGERSARLRVAVMGGRIVIGLSKATRAELGVDLGDTVTAVVSLDESPREVEVPAELAAALEGDRTAYEMFGALAYTHRKEYAVWVGEAKRPETRVRRAAQAVEMIRSGERR